MSEGPDKKVRTSIFKTKNMNSNKGTAVPDHFNVREI
jgi:hypothetical protein